ncbi:hypothetical protein [Natronorubrum aibiense]|uniref:Uncharacterized protein n=1 Tax=Natronorubrum aibiense TaxID=348826 RepID=A0A5P9P5W9_9EURY|nr:hypothetical protein [Natronorubrum aibiense]QFU83476.1 hypothetical protein GCU68_13460 [Natronorubrum aibiense]
MRALSVELEDELVDALEAERALFGFESRQAYVRWIIEHRGSIEADQPADRSGDRDRDRDRLLAEYGKRLNRLEDRVSALSSTADRDEDRTDDGADAGDTNGATPTSTVDAADSDRDGYVPADQRDRSSQCDDAETMQSAEPVLEVRGSPRTVRHGPEATDQRDGEASRTASGTRADGGSAATDDSSVATTDAAVESDADQTAATPTLSPERVARIPEDPVVEDAGVLGSVETERLDELSRRAVATTRKRLNREVQTGLEYTSSTRLADDGVRPGEDVADLEALSIPGRSAETIEKRRHAVGRALAYVRDEGRARRSDFVEALYKECPAGYETEDGWWRCIKTGLKQVDCVDGGEGSRVWHYRR